MLAFDAEIQAICEDSLRKENEQAGQECSACQSLWQCLGQMIAYLLLLDAALLVRRTVLLVTPLRDRVDELRRAVELRRALDALRVGLRRVVDRLDDRLAVDRLDDDDRRADERLADERLAVERLAVFRFAVFRLAVPRFAVLRFAVLRLALVDFFATLRLVVRFLVALRLAFVDFLAAGRRVALFFFAPLRFAFDDFLATFRFTDFFAPRLAVVDFFAVRLAAPLRERVDRDADFFLLLLLVLDRVAISIGSCETVLGTLRLMAAHPGTRMSEAAVVESVQTSLWVDPTLSS